MLSDIVHFFIDPLYEGGQKTKENHEAVEMSIPFDILIITPSRLLAHQKKVHVHFSDLRYLIIDDADTILDAPYDTVLREIIAPLKLQIQNTTNRTQVAIVSATITEAVMQFTRREFMNLKFVISPFVHRSVKSLKTIFLEATLSNKKQLLRKILRAPSNKGKRTLIFCNSKESCLEVFTVGIGRIFFFRRER